MTMSIQPVIRTALLVGVMVMSTASVALAKDSKGVVLAIAADESAPQALQVRLQGVASFCDGTAAPPHVAYLAKTSPLYDTLVNKLIEAYMDGKPITIRSSQSGSICVITGAILD